MNFVPLLERLVEELAAARPDGIRVIRRACVYPIADDARIRHGCTMSSSRQLSGQATAHTIAPGRRHHRHLPVTPESSLAGDRVAPLTSSSMIRIVRLRLSSQRTVISATSGAGRERAFEVGKRCGMPVQHVGERRLCASGFYFGRPGRQTVGKAQSFALICFNAKCEKSVTAVACGSKQRWKMTSFGLMPVF